MPNCWFIFFRAIWPQVSLISQKENLIGVHYHLWSSFEFYFFYISFQQTNLQGGPEDSRSNVQGFEYNDDEGTTANLPSYPEAVTGESEEIETHM